MDDSNALSASPQEELAPPPARGRRLRPVPTNPEETLAELRFLAERRFGAIPADALARHVVRVTEGGDWPLRRAALEAIARRCKFGERDGLVVKLAPVGTVFGRYVTGRLDEPAPKRKGKPDAAARRLAAKAAARPYETELLALEPLRASCDCPDFLRGALGVCKHALTALDHLYAEGRATNVAAPGARPGLVIGWDPIRPLSGEGDRLLGLRLTGTAASKRELPAAVTRAAAWFGADGSLRGGALASLGARERFLDELRAALATARGPRPALRPEPAARALIAEEQARLTRRTAGRRAAPAALRHLGSLKRKLYPYQLEGVRRFLEEEHLLLADDMGLGKTTQAIAACHALFRAGAVRRGLLVVPAALKPQWVREWEATSDVPITAIDGTADERARAYRKFGAGFAVIGYEQLLRDLDEVRALDPQMVVLDEAQRIKNWQTKSAVYVKSLTPRYRLVLTGTPMENRLDELASILDWVDDVALAPKWRLEPWHTYADGDGSAGRAGARNLDTLRTRIAPVVVRRLRKEVLTQLPPRTDTRVSVPMTDAQRVEHDDLLQPIAALIGKARVRPLTQPEFLRLMTMLTQQRIISNGLGQARFEEIWPVYGQAHPDPALLDGLFAPKLLELRRIVEEIVVGQGRRAVVFSQWRRMLRLAEWSLRDLLADAGLRAAFFTGAESPAVRTRNIIDFHDEPDVRILFLSDAGGVGLNLQRAASCCINLELPWNPAVLEQRIGRIYRLGQDHPIDVYNLVTEYGIESRIAALNASKRALFSGLFDGTTDEVRFETKVSFLSDVEKLVPVAPEFGTHALHAADDPAPEDTRALRATPGEAPAAPETRRAEPLAEPSPEPEAAPAVTPLAAEPAAVTDVTARHALFAGVRLERTADGGLRLEAPPEAAATLSALFEGMARLLRESRA